MAMNVVERAALFRARAEAVACVVHAAPDRATALQAAEELRAAKEAAGVSAAVVEAAAGVAATGTCLVLATDEQTRLATMRPEASILVLDAANLVDDLPDAAPLLRAWQTAGGASYVSFITGPSRTADIERVGAIGVHGPLECHVVLAGGAA